jgi:prefoldin subunit 5
MEAITYNLYRTPDTYKNIFKDADENLKKIQDKVDCLQRSQVYVHNHISKVENDLNQLKDLILRRLTDVESYNAQISEVN